MVSDPVEMLELPAMVWKAGGEDPLCFTAEEEGSSDHQQGVFMVPIQKLIAGAAFGLALSAGALFATADGADKAKVTKVAHVPSERETRSPMAGRPIPGRARDSEYVFGAPPEGSYAEQATIYEPIAEFLSRITGKRFVFRYSDNWLTYSRDMTNEAYDLVFDAAALNSWRIERINHTPLLRLSGETVYLVVGRPDNSKIRELKNLAGHGVCAPLPPDIATLALLSQFNNPARQPVIVESTNWNAMYKNLREGKCDGAIITRQYLDRIDRKLVKVIYRHRAMPNNALSAGPRISPELQERIRQALLTPQGKAATAKLRAAHNAEELVPARGEDYAGLGKLLKNSLYYY